MHRLFMVVLLLNAMATVATAQTTATESHSAAVRLVQALNWRGMMEPVRAGQVARVKTDLHARMREELGSPTAEEYAEVDSVLDQLLSKYTLDDTIADIVQLFQEHYGAAEMEELATIVSTPVYKRFQADLLEINREALESVNRKMQPAIQETVNSVSARIDEMKKTRSGK